MAQTLELDLQKLSLGDENTIQSLAQYITVYVTRLLEQTNTQIDVVDVLQDVLYKVIQDPKYLADLGTTEKVLNYCRIMAKNSILIHTRRAQKEEYVLNTYKDEIDQSDQELKDHPDINAETYNRIMTALDQLPETQRIIIRLVVLEGKKPREIAKELGLTNAQVRVLKYRALQQLRKLVLDGNIEENTG